MPILAAPCAAFDAAVWWERSRAERFARGREALRALIGDVAVTAAVCPDCGRRHGAPLLADGRFASVSHASGGSLAAVADRAVGVDVEDRPLRLLPAVAVPPGEDPLQHWTRVEAVLKADGRGLRVDPDAVLFAPGEGGWRATLDGRVYVVHDLALDGRHAAAVAVAAE